MPNCGIVLISTALYTLAHVFTTSIEKPLCQVNEDAKIFTKSKCFAHFMKRLGGEQSENQIDFFVFFLKHYEYGEIVGLPPSESVLRKKYDLYMDTYFI